MCTSKHIVHALLASFVVAALSGCSEEVQVHTRNMDRTFLVVEAMLTDQPSAQQCVVLTESIDFFVEEVPPAVSGAKVSVSDGVNVYPFVEESAGSGRYVGPAGFCGTPGVTYKLEIDATVDGELNHYEAFSTMESPGFRVDAVDYMYAGDADTKIDSLWTIAVWGQDFETVNYYYVSAKLNDAVFPIGLSLAIDDKYFNGQKVFCFPITTLYQTEATRKSYGDCGKYLETGDVFTLNVYTIPKDYFDFYMGFVSSTVGAAIPMLQSQPANCPTNIVGKNAMGYFFACSSSSASVTIEEPLRPYYKLLFPFGPSH